MFGHFQDSPVSLVKRKHFIIIITSLLFSRSLCVIKTCNKIFLTCNIIDNNHVTKTFSLGNNFILKAMQKSNLLGSYDIFVVTSCEIYKACHRLISYVSYYYKVTAPVRSSMCTNIINYTIW